jgi:hypothetical protein
VINGIFIDKKKRKSMITKIKTGTIIVLLITFFCAAGIVYGQDKAAIAERNGGMGYFMGGVGMISESGNNSIIYSAGGGGHALKNRLIIGGEGHSSFGPHNAGGYGFFDIGYAPVVKGRVILYPLIGIGGGSMTGSDDTVSKCVLLNPSVGCDYLLFRKARSGILLGLRAGYIFTMYSNTFNWSMPYIRLAVGAFGFEK